MTNTDALEALEQRGLVDQLSNRTGLTRLLSSPGASIYIGFDPTARSLHVGHLLPVMALAHLQRLGHCPIMLVGGATGMIGNPSGRSDERQLLTPDQVVDNARAIREQLEHFVAFEGPSAARLVNNHDWIAPMSYVDWLREVGKHFTVNYMLAKSSVKDRLDREQGVSYTEFSYMLMQAFDFLHLYRAFGCSIQGGGSDQWGNITAGIDLVRKVCGVEVFGVTFPLVMTSTGEKFGKSAGNAVWLSPELTTPYRFYQYWMQTDDRDVAAQLRFFTFMSIPEIDEILADHGADPGERRAQRRLAQEITGLVHGFDSSHRAQHASDALFGGVIGDLTESELGEIFADVPSVEIPRTRLADNFRLVDLLVEAGASASKSEARRQIEGGGVYINNERATTADDVVTEGRLLAERNLVLRTGKRRYTLVRFAS